MGQLLIRFSQYFILQKHSKILAKCLIIQDLNFKPKILLPYFTSCKINLKITVSSRLLTFYNHYFKSFTK